ncbi:MAG: hypothetical protein AYL31_004110 [Candidatus Bathyarchaeota archaeon B26-1]|nr:MAG: hypothetical protein AYL31_004110 [Candidatus Bathyarchaeota archaeon B26-1]
MSTRLEERLERILRVIENLAREAAMGVPIIVEGVKDLKALNRLNVKGDILLAKASGKTFLGLLGEIEERGKPEVILLLDFDRRGREWTRLLVENLERNKIKPNITYWRELRSLAGREVKDIEGLSRCVETLKRKVNRD